MHFRMVALLVVLAAVLLRVLHTVYSACPGSPPEGCSCDIIWGSSVVTVNSEDGAIDTCMAGLSASGHTSFHELFVEDYPVLILKKDIFQAVQFRDIYFSNTSIQRVDPNFLGNSQNFTEMMQFYSCLLLEGFPKINAEVLKKLHFSNIDYSPDTRLTLPTDAFSGTPALEKLTIHTNEIRAMTVQRATFWPLTKLRKVNLAGSSRLRRGAGHFSSPHLEEIKFGFYDNDTFHADPSSLSGIPARAVLNIHGGKVLGSWSPSKFFNILREEAHIRVRDAFECGCDLAWIRYSSFLGQVDISCLTGGGSRTHLSGIDLSHCQFYKDQYLPKTKL